MGKIKTSSNMRLLLLLFALCGAQSLFAGNVVIDKDVLFIDAKEDKFKGLQAGDTVFIKAGLWKQMIIRDFVGTADKYITFINYQGKLLISNNESYGVSIRNCQYIRFSGNGVPGISHGIEINTSVGGALGVGFGSSDYEIEHIEISRSIGPGMLLKTDPACDFLYTRDKFIQRNISIHHNYVHHTTTEGIYMGSTFFGGQNFRCNSKDTLLLPHITHGLKLYKNVTYQTGWDGIQVASCFNSLVYDNIVIEDSQAKVSSQMNGIIVGDGTTGLFYNNLIMNGEGSGMLIFSSGRLYAFNNIIISPGKNNNLADGKYGIYCDTRFSLGKENFINILNNLVVDAKVEGIRHIGIENFARDTIANNVIINGLGANGAQLNFLGKGALASNNVVLNSFSSTGYCQTDSLLFELCSASELVNAGLYNSTVAAFPDFYGMPRLVGSAVDLGPSEYQTLVNRLDNSDALYLCNVSPNPTLGNAALQLGFYPQYLHQAIKVEVFSVKGDRLLSIDSKVTMGLMEFPLNSSAWPVGAYQIQISLGEKQLKSTRLLRL